MTRKCHSLKDIFANCSNIALWFGPALILTIRSCSDIALCFGLALILTIRVVRIQRYDWDLPLSWPFVLQMVKIRASPNHSAISERWVLFIFRFSFFFQLDEFIPLHTFRRQRTPSSMLSYSPLAAESVQRKRTSLFFNKIYSMKLWCISDSCADSRMTDLYRSSLIPATPT